MQHRVLFIGDAAWLDSASVRAIRAHCRVVTTATAAIGPFAELPLADDPTAALVRLSDDLHGAARVISALSQPCRSIRCLAVAGGCGEDIVRACVDAQAWGIIDKDADAGRYLDALDWVAGGKLDYPPDVADRIVTRGGRMSLATAEATAVSKLRPDELQLLRLLCEGHSSTAAAGIIGVDPNQTRRELAALMRRLDLPNRAALVRFAVRAGIVDP